MALNKCIIITVIIVIIINVYFFIVYKNSELLFFKMRSDENIHENCQTEEVPLSFKDSGSDADASNNETDNDDSLHYYKSS